MNAPDPRSLEMDERLDHLLDWLDNRYMLNYSSDINMRRRNQHWEDDKINFRALVKEVLVIATRS